MIDLHTHILPCVDDGARNTEESLKMLQDSIKQGVDTCVATPHCVLHRPCDLDRFIKRRERGYNELQKAVKGGEYPNILLGAEVYLDNDISKFDGIEQLCFTGTPYMLLEYPIHGQDKQAAEWVYKLTLKGIKPIIAHIDRYMNNMSMIEDLREVPCVYQINGARFLNFYGRRILKKLFKTGKKFVVASDMHNFVFRKCNMGKAKNVAEDAFDGKCRFVTDINKMR